MGPLAGLRIIELVGIGPGPFCGMILADLGAEVIGVSRKGSAKMIPPRCDLMARGKRSLVLDLKTPDGVEAFLRLAESADAVFEGFRPGVVDRLGVGPEACRARNPRLVYAQMTGWGQTGPLARAAGHDINFIALSGALWSMGRDAGAPPIPPLNLVGDFGGGGLMMALGIVCALLETRTSGEGQVIDVSMVEGSSLMMAMFHSMLAAGLWSRARGTNLLDGGAHFYDTYETGDGGYIAIASLEPQFYALLKEKLALDPELFDDQLDRDRWPEQKQALQAIFRTRTRDEWCELLEGSDVCFAPVLSMWEAPQHPHNEARGSFIEVDGITQPAPAPRFSRTPPGPPGAIAAPGADTRAILASIGYSTEAIEALLAAGAALQA